MEDEIPRRHEGRVSAKGRKFAVVVSQFNKTITERLLDGALTCLRQHGADLRHNIEVFYCPGAFEIPQVASYIARHWSFDAVVCLGAVIRGETPHFEYVAGECARGIGAVARERDIPVLFGVLTTDTYDQAMERSGGSIGNKGWDAALGAIVMVDLYAQLRSRSTKE